MHLEQQVVDINHNVNLFMAGLNSKMGIFGEDGGSNAEDKYERGLEYWGENKNQLKKKSKKE